MKQNIYKIQLRKICHRTAAGRCLHCPVCSGERILEALNNQHTDRARSAKAGFSRRRSSNRRGFFCRAFIFMSPLTRGGSAPTPRPRPGGHPPSAAIPLPGSHPPSAASPLPGGHPHSKSSSGATSNLSGKYLPFFFLCLTHSVRRYSICPFTDRKSSSAQAAIASYSCLDSRRGTCFFVLSAIAASIQASRINDRLCVMVSAQDNQKIRNHCSLAFLIQCHKLAFV